jgi:hypothetical protein
MLLKGNTRQQIRIVWVIYAAILTDNRRTTQSFILLSGPGPADRMEFNTAPASSHFCQK